MGNHRLRRTVCPDADHGSGFSHLSPQGNRREGTYTLAMHPGRVDVRLCILSTHPVRSRHTASLPHQRLPPSLLPACSRDLGGSGAQPSQSLEEVFAFRFPVCGGGALHACADGGAAVGFEACARAAVGFEAVGKRRNDHTV